MSPFLPHPQAPHAGGRAIYQWLAGLARRHEITLVCRITADERRWLEPVRALCRAVHLVEFDRPGPAAAARTVASYFRLGHAARRLMNREAFDLLHVEYVETGIGLPARLPIPAILIAHDELTKPMRRRLALGRAPARLIGRLYCHALARLERRICRKFDRILVASDVDRRGLLDLEPGLPVEVLPFPAGPATPARPTARSEKPDLLFVGAMHRETNAAAMRYFCGEILPLIRTAVPEARLTIVGHAPPPEIRRLASDPAIRVVGYVPDLRPHYAAATVFVAPMRVGGGIIVKTLDAMAAGCPVVTTTIGNEGIGATPGRHLLAADDPAAFAAAVVHLLGDGDTRRRLAAEARRFVESRFSLDACLDRLESTYRDVCAR